MSCPMKNAMAHVAPKSLEDLPSRIQYLSSFLDLTQVDADALTGAAHLIAPLVPAVLEEVYIKLLSYDITAQAFVPRNSDYDGETVNDVQELTLQHPQILMRKDFLKNYLIKLVSTKDLSPESPFWVYLDKVGIMHTGKPGFKHRESRADLRVEYIHMGALLGHVMSVVVSAVMDMDDVPNPAKKAVIVALNKVLWIQNDLFARHYITESVEDIDDKLNKEERDSSQQVGLFGGILKNVGLYRGPI